MMSSKEKVYYTPQAYGMQMKTMASNTPDVNYSFYPDLIITKPPDPYQGQCDSVCQRDHVLQSCQRHSRRGQR